MPSASSRKHPSLSDGQFPLYDSSLPALPPSILYYPRAVATPCFIARSTAGFWHSAPIIRKDAAAWCARAGPPFSFTRARGLDVSLSLSWCVGRPIVGLLQTFRMRAPILPWWLGLGYIHIYAYTDVFSYTILHVSLFPGLFRENDTMAVAALGYLRLLYRLNSDRMALRDGFGGYFRAHENVGFIVVFFKCWYLSVMCIKWYKDLTLFNVNKVIQL